MSYRSVAFCYRRVLGVGLTGSKLDDGRRCRPGSAACQPLLAVLRHNSNANGSRHVGSAPPSHAYQDRLSAELGSGVDGSWQATVVVAAKTWWRCSTWSSTPPSRVGSGWTSKADQDRQSPRIAPPDATNATGPLCGAAPLLHALSFEGHGHRHTATQPVLDEPDSLT
jgi:hypothetical protein